jgi:DNA-binding CsgD family transcriptional regulator
MAYCGEHDLDSWSRYMQGCLAGVLLEQGRTGAAVRLAEEVLRHPHLSVVSQIQASLVTGVTAVRRGDQAANLQLAELPALARRIAEPQRLLPVALLQAEAAWTTGRPANIVELTEQAWTDCAGGWEPWILAELAWWRALGGAADDVPFGLPEPFALMRDGRARAASDAWTAIGRPFWAALALAAGDPADASDAVAALLRLGAPATAQAVRRDLARRGLPVPRGPRGVARANPAGLTARELDVLRCLVDGLSNADIARLLTLSERTVGHHVSAILHKLGVPTRSRAAAAAAQILGALSRT